MKKTSSAGDILLEKLFNCQSAACEALFLQIRHGVWGKNIQMPMGTLIQIRRHVNFPANIAD